jgi:hypothetical protein
MASGAVEPAFAASRADLNLCVEDVLAHFIWLSRPMAPNLKSSLETGGVSLNYK